MAEEIVLANNLEFSTYKAGMFGWNGTNWQPVRLDAATRATQVIDYAHHEIHAGSHYTLSYAVADIGAATTPTDIMSLSFTTPDTTKWLHMVVSATSVAA